MTAPAITRVTLFRNTVNDIGTATSFDITAEFLASVTPTNDGTTITYAGANINRTGLSPGTTYHYWLETEDCCSNVTDQYLGTITTAAPYANTYSTTFDGVNEFTETTNSEAAFFSGASTMTVSFWVNHVVVPISAVRPYFGASGPGSGASTRFLMYRLGSSTWIEIGNGNNNVYNSGVWAPAAGRWYHVAAVYDGSQTGAAKVKLYIDGVAKTSTLNNGTLPSTLPSWTTQTWAINDFEDTRTNNLNMKMDEVSVFSEALSAVQVTELYNSGAPGSLQTPAPRHWWRMGEGATFGTQWTIPDEMGNGDMTSANMEVGDRTTDVPMILVPDITAAVDFDGTTDRLQALGSNTFSSKEMTVSCWVRLDHVGGSGVSQHCIVSSRTEPTTAGDIRLAWTLGKLYLIAWNETTQLVQLNTTSGTTLGVGVWYHIIASFNTATSTGQMYINDVNENPTVASMVADGLVYWNETRFNIGYSILGSQYVNGCVAELYMTDEYVDLSVEANRRKFISASGAPVSLGADGSTPTGTQPRIYLSGQATNWNGGKNFGSWSDFAVTGALTNCASVPGVSSQVIPTWVDLNTTNVGTITGSFSALNVASGNRFYDEVVYNDYIDVTIQATLPDDIYISRLEPVLSFSGNNQLAEIKFYNSSNQLVQSNSYSTSSIGGGTSPPAVVIVDKPVKRMTARIRRLYGLSFTKMLLFGFQQ